LLDAFAAMPIALFNKSFYSVPGDGLADLLAARNTEPVEIGLVLVDVQNQKIIRKRFSSFIYSPKFRVLPDVVLFDFQF
jgi:hypothetical protein